jgi:hypothetical protein
LTYSCTTPLPTSGLGNFINAPLFVDYASGNLRLQSDSPCINAGSNASAPAGPDLDGNPRIVSGHGGHWCVRVSIAAIADLNSLRECEQRQSNAAVHQLDDRSRNHPGRR